MQKKGVEDLFNFFFGEPTEKDRKAIDQLYNDLKEYKLKKDTCVEKENSKERYNGFEMKNMENGDGVVVIYYIPSLTKEDIAISINEDILHVVGKKDVPYFGKLNSKVKMKFNVDVSKTKAKVENGVLTINVFKLISEKELPFVIKID